MQAWGVRQFLPTTDRGCFEKFTCAMPSGGELDLLIELRAIAINPVDAKRRALVAGVLDQPRILGWDAAGVVVACGAGVSGFAVGDEVFYAGDVTRPGCNAQYQCVDHRLVAHKPRSLDFAAAAALPLTSLTAWEGLHERVGLVAGQTILIIGGGGGVGSMAIQLAKRAGMRVVATAAREQSRAWAEEMGADVVIAGREGLTQQWQDLGIGAPDVIANFVDSDAYWREMGELIAPLGSLLLIVEPKQALRVGDPLKAKCVRVCWEFMFARAMFQTADMAQQGGILQQVAAAVDRGELRSPVTRHLGKISTDALREAHSAMEQGIATGKWVMEF